MNVSYKDYTKEFLQKMENAKKRGLQAIGMTAERHAKKITPVDTGRLRNSIANTSDSEAAYIGTNVEYAPFVELGARGRTGVHFLQRAATEHADEYKKLLEDSIKNA